MPVAPELLWQHPTMDPQPHWGQAGSQTNHTMMGTLQGPQASPSPWACCRDVLCPLELRGSSQHCPMSHKPPKAPRRDGVCWCPGAPCNHTMSACTRPCPTAPVPARCVPELGTTCAAGFNLQPWALVTSSSHVLWPAAPNNYSNYRTAGLGGNSTSWHLPGSGAGPGPRTRPLWDCSTILSHQCRGAGTAPLPALAWHCQQCCHPCSSCQGHGHPHLEEQLRQRSL